MSLRAHFERRAEQLSHLAALEVSERDGATTLSILPRSAAAVGVTLYLVSEHYGRVALDDQACVPIALDEGSDSSDIDYFVDMAVAGRATAFHLGRGGCVEVLEADGRIHRTWTNAWPWPGWRSRATRIACEPYG